jgi:hypothetical protein
MTYNRGMGTVFKIENNYKSNRAEKENTYLYVLIAEIYIYIGRKQNVWSNPRR